MNKIPLTLMMPSIFPVQAHLAKFQFNGSQPHCLPLSAPSLMELTSYQIM